MTPRAFLTDMYKVDDFIKSTMRLVGEKVKPSAAEASEEHPEAGPSSSHVTTSEAGPAGHASRRW